MRWKTGLGHRLSIANLPTNMLCGLVLLAACCPFPFHCCCRWFCHCGRSLEIIIIIAATGFRRAVFVVINHGRTHVSAGHETVAFAALLHGDELLRVHARVEKCDMVGVKVRTVVALSDVAHRALKEIQNYN